jgi:hypothetical protein
MTWTETIRPHHHISYDVDRGGKPANIELWRL